MTNMSEYGGIWRLRARVLRVKSTMESEAHTSGHVVSAYTRSYDFALHIPENFRSSIT